MFCTLLSVDIWGVKIVDDVLLIGDTKADETAVPPISKTIDNPLFMMNLFFILYYQAAAAMMIGRGGRVSTTLKAAKNVLKRYAVSLQKDTLSMKLKRRRRSWNSLHRRINNKGMILGTV